MSKFTVYLMTPYCTWENVEAKDEDEAIRKCDSPPEFDWTEPHTFLAVEEEEEDESN